MISGQTYMILRGRCWAHLRFDLGGQFRRLDFIYYRGISESCTTLCYKNVVFDSNSSA